MEAARSSGRTPPGPRLKGVGAGVAGRPVLPPLREIRNKNIIEDQATIFSSYLDIPSVSTRSLLMPAASCSARTLSRASCSPPPPRAGLGEKGVGVGVAGLLPLHRPSSWPRPRPARLLIPCRGDVDSCASVDNEC